MICLAYAFIILLINIFILYKDKSNVSSLSMSRSHAFWIWTHGQRQIDMIITQLAFETESEPLI